MTFRVKMTRKQRFHALHSTVDTDTLMIHASRICARPGGDAKYLVPVLKRVDYRRLDAVYADKTYISRKNVQYIADLGAYPGIEPKRGLRGKARGFPAYRKLIRGYQKDPAGWNEKHTYGKRSLVVTVFGMMKVRFGGGLSSRGFKEQRRELLIKELVHNIERLNYLECASW